MNMKFKIKKDDEVIVIAGKDKGRRGKVKKILTKTDKLIVDGINLVTKHLKGDPSRGVDSSVVQVESAIHISNVAIYNPVTQKKDRVKSATLGDGKKVRVYRSTGEQIELV